MSVEFWATATLLAGLAATFTQGLPQAVRTVWHRRTAGLSVLGLWAVLLLNLVWLGFAFTTGDWVLLAGNTVTGTVAAAVLAVQWNLRPRRQPGLVDVAGLVAVVTVTVAAADGADRLLAGTAAALGVAWGIPQLVKLVRARDVDGVAPATYVVALAGAGAWAAHWALVGEPWLVASCGYTIIILAASLTLLLWRRRALSAAGPCRRSASVRGPAGQ